MATSLQNETMCSSSHGRAIKLLVKDIVAERRHDHRCKTFAKNLLLTIGERIGTFMAGCAGYIINRLDVRKNGKTAYERVKGKAATVCISVGMKARSAELPVRRIPVEENWSEDSVRWVKHVPWYLSNDHTEADGDMAEEKEVQVEEHSKQQFWDCETQRIKEKTRQVPPRTFQIRREDAERHGYMKGCARCSSWFRLSADCWSRFAAWRKILGTRMPKRGK